MEGHLKGALYPLESIQTHFACSSVNFTLYVSLCSVIKCERRPHRNSVLLDFCYPVRTTQESVYKLPIKIGRNGWITDLSLGSRSGRSSRYTHQSADAFRSMKLSAQVLNYSPTVRIRGADSHIPRINKRKDMIEATGVATLTRSPSPSSP